MIPVLYIKFGIILSFVGTTLSLGEGLGKLNILTLTARMTQLTSSCIRFYAAAQLKLELIHHVTVTTIISQLHPRL